MRKKGENSVKCPGKYAIPPDKIMISPLRSKVNLSNFAHFADLCAAVLWWKVLNPLYNPARLHQPGQCLGCGRRRPARIATADGARRVVGAWVRL
jgi:hypothetical protein